MSKPWWVYIEREDSADLAIGPYPSEAAAKRAGEDSLLVEDLLSPSGGGGTDCYWSQDQPTDQHEHHIVDLSNYQHTGEDEDCDGSHIERPHRWRYGPNLECVSPVCQRSGCNVMGTGDRCGDGECEGAPDPDVILRAQERREEDLRIIRKYNDDSEG